MASGTTYQALKRVSWLPERDASYNGEVIAGQQYDDVFFIGGTIENVNLVNCSFSPPISGSTGYTYEETVSSGTTHTTTNTNTFVVWNSATTGAKTSTIPMSTGSKQIITIMDKYGNAGTYNIKAVPVSGSITGNAVCYTNGSSITLYDSQSGWLSI